MWEGEVPEVFVRNNVYSPSCVFCLVSFVFYRVEEEEEEEVEEEEEEEETFLSPLQDFSALGLLES